MAKFQSRRAVSFRAEVFVALEELCKAQGVSLAAYVEDAVRNKMAIAGVELPSHEAAVARLKARAPRKEVPPSFEDVISGVRML